MVTAKDIRDARQAGGLTQEKLAAAAGLASATVRNVESGRTTPSRRTLERLRLVIELPHNGDGSDEAELRLPPVGGAVSDTDGQS